MLIKEYRIPLPLTVEEYRIAQLYMIAKKSREESRGAGSGVEILVNEPYENGPGGNGQYTHKIYHIGSHLPGWLKSLLPRSVLCVEEEAWNCYPYTKTRYTCPFVEKFLLEIETYYFPDRGNQENVFKLSGNDLRNRIVDLIDVVNDQLHGADYVKDEDPLYFVSQKTKRGPLLDQWINQYWTECKDKVMPRPNGMSIMCAYKLCRVEFRYWGMQTKLEKFIHDTALRKTMLRAHRQAWAWQDEWFGLTMDDIRQIEKQTQEALKMTMGGGEEGEEEEEGETKPTNGNTALAATLGSIENPEEEPCDNILHSQPKISVGEKEGKFFHREVGSSGGKSPTGAEMSAATWRMESIIKDSDSLSDQGEDEFFDCQEDASSLARWSSLELLNESADVDESPPPSEHPHEESLQFSHKHQKLKIGGSGMGESSQQPPCGVTSLILVLHAGSILDPTVDLTAKKSDITTFRGAIETVIRSHYPNMIGHLALRLVSCPSVCSDSLAILSSLSPYSFDVSPLLTDAPHPTHDSMPIAAVPLLSTCSPDYQEAVTKTVQGCNSVYSEFVKSDEGRGFTGCVSFVGDSIGSILAYDALCRSGKPDPDYRLDDDSLLEMLGDARQPTLGLQQPEALKFEVKDFFMFGSPLSLVLAHRKLSDPEERRIGPGVQQVYNMFHPSDPMSSRLEPLLCCKFSYLPPINVPRFQKYPLGNGQHYHLLDVVQSNSQLFVNSDGGVVGLQRRASEISILSNASGVMDSVPLHTVKSLSDKWWGSKRLDYALYCPEGLTNFPTHALPHLFHASYWESSDVIAFLLRQIGKFELGVTTNQEDQDWSSHNKNFTREKWVRKRTSVKIKNVAANHRANDVVVREGLPQVLCGRFMYGPLDMITLTGEKVDLYVMTDTVLGGWTLLSTEITDKNGRVSYEIPQSKALPFGFHSVKMVVRGDQSFVDLSLAVIPPATECVVFSIDGSFTASVSVTGRDPRVRACAVDVVRHWQELGFLILYITGRPDIQQSRVLAWLSQHNFPQGLVSFADGLSTDPLGHKAVYLKSLIQEHGVIIHAAYGSSKDISVYCSLGLTPSQIFIVGKVSKKHHSSATVLTEGYAAHLTCMNGRSRPAHGNARMVLGPRPTSASFRRRGGGSGFFSKRPDV